MCPQCFCYLPWRHQPQSYSSLRTRRWVRGPVPCHVRLAAFFVARSSQQTQLPKLVARQIVTHPCVSNISSKCKSQALRNASGRMVSSFSKIAIAYLLSAWLCGTCQAPTIPWKFCPQAPRLALHDGLHLIPEHRQCSAGGPAHALDGAQELLDGMATKSERDTHTCTDMQTDTYTHTHTCMTLSPFQFGVGDFRRPR